MENHFFGQAVVPALVAGQQIYRGFYRNDTYHLTNKLTLNLGIRYDLQGPGQSVSTGNPISSLPHRAGWPIPATAG